MSDLPPPPPDDSGWSSQPSPPDPPQEHQVPATPKDFSAELDPHLVHMPLRSYGAMMALALLFPIHFFFLRKVGLGVAYWVTALAVGWLLFFIPHLIWWFINLFLVKGWVIQYNESILEARKRTQQS